MTQELLAQSLVPALSSPTGDCSHRLLLLWGWGHSLAGESVPHSTNPKLHTHLHSSEHLLRAAAPKLVFLPGD